MRRLPWILLLCAACAHRPPAPAEAPPEPAAEPAAPSPRAGVVSAAHPLAAEAGRDVLQAGGNAFDAAVATALVLGVVNPQSSGLGGGGFAVWRQADGATGSLDFREVAPSFFARDTYAVEGRSSTRGPWSTGVPGEAAGLASLHAAHGVLPWADLVEPARRVAAEGFPVGPDLAAALGRMGEGILADPGLASVLSVDGEVLAEGETCRRPALADTLQYLQLHGGRGLYSGPLAVSLSGFLAGQGVPWTEAELAAYAPREREPLRGQYRGLSIVTMGPPSSGGIALLQTLGVLEQADHRAQGYGSLSWTRTLTAGLRHAFADRAAYGGDPDFVELPLSALLDPALFRRLWDGTPAAGPVPLDQAGLAGERSETTAAPTDDSGTSHLSVLDADGRMVALTTTVNLLFGSGQADPGTGIVLNDEMDDFTARPGEPNAFGLVQSEANAVQPGKRPLSSMTPTLVLQDGQPRLAVGGAGGPRIITGTLQTLLGVVDGDLSGHDAVARGRLHHQWLPDELELEAGWDEAARQGLTDEGFTVIGLRYAGRIHAATRAEDGSFGGGADPRGGGAVAVSQP